MNNADRVQSGTAIEHSFDNCPECNSGELEYQTQAHALCLDCEANFYHEIRSDGHLLWSFTGDLSFDEVVDRVA